ncbi:MAG: 16S rRNA (cytosine(1402)-N(4))-methyltransferase RsmH [Candidatus Kerfeldbacteria bacterium]|nr:16S rRNA (cytosine(1402)-N(4))-methyltransferase RsmH [Candidatus Kerfeldbacteria bacterium]
MGPVRTHIPVLRQEVLSLLDPRPGQHTVDATVGAGGHAAAILERTAPDGRLLAIDLDPAALEIARQNLKSFAGRITFVHSGFDNLKQILHDTRFLHPTAILADLGLSSASLQDSSRGFSFQLVDSPLDMRFDPSSRSGEIRTAADILNLEREAELARIIYEYGEERQSRAIARAIVETRARQPIRTVGDLVSIIARVIRRRGHLHPATRTFQALRLAVNDELGRLERFLPQAIEALVPGGRLAVISFHSLEDRMVKQFFRQQAAASQVRILTKHPATPGFAEVTTNPRSRSAKLRVVVRTSPPTPLL